MKRLNLYFLMGTLFTIMAGTLSHFLYEWSGFHPIVGIFTPVNESTWEHMKLIFFPMLLADLVMIRNLKQDFPCISTSLIFGTLLGTLLIPIIFYTYSGTLGFHLLILDIATFIISVIAAFYAAYQLTLSCNVEKHKTILTILLIAVLICFITFTYFPPNIGLFDVPGT